MSESWLVERGLSCQRCGQCCIAVGRSFWRHGDFTGCPELEKLATETESVDEGLPCAMLDMSGGVASCRIETKYGRQFKPEGCRQYPSGPCWYYGNM
jgi:Fe-S-cluster containining protein